MNKKQVKKFLARLLLVVTVIGAVPAIPAQAQMSTQQKTQANFIDVQSGSYHTVALDDEGRVYTWGGDNDLIGRTANSTTERRDEAVQLTVLPYITKISASNNQSLALDVDGNIWSWGTNNAYNLAHSNQIPPKKVDNMPVKAVDIAAGRNGGRYIGTDGSIYVWGRGLGTWGVGLDANGFALGTGNNESKTSPVKLTTDVNGNPLPTNFIEVYAADYDNFPVNIARTADNKIYTWGVNGGSDSAVAAAGGSKKPKLVTAAWAQPIRQIDCGNGFWGVLDANGVLWTWGSNRGLAATERLGHSGSATAVSTPTPVTQVRAYSGSTSWSTVTVPKFKSFSAYAWNILALDVNNKVYISGERVSYKSYDTHGTDVYQSGYLAEYKPYYVPKGKEIYTISLGYSSAAFITSEGNAYINSGTANYRGAAASRGTPASDTWVHVSVPNPAPLFTSIVSTPDENTKIYDSAKAGINVTLSGATDEVKYVILYQDDIQTYTDGKTFYSKSSFELERPYYFAGTNRKELVSPNGSSYTARYYANPRISEAVFNAAYSVKAAIGEAGTLNKTDSTHFSISNRFGDNCIVWLQSKAGTLTQRIILPYDNSYTQTKVWMKGVRADNPSQILYMPQLVSGYYGLPLNRDKTALEYTNEAPLGWDVVQPNDTTLASVQWPEKDYWTLDPSTQKDLAAAVDEYGVRHRIDPTKEIILNNYNQYVDGPADNTTVTFTYKKNPLKWFDVTLKFVYENGDPVSVWHEGGVYNTTDVIRSQMVPAPPAVLSMNDPYTPPVAQDTNDVAVGYKVGATAPNGTGSYTPCNFPDGFNPLVSTPTTIYIVYKPGMLKVSESYKQVPLAGAEIFIANNQGVSNRETIYSSGENVSISGPAIYGQILTGYRLKKEDGTLLNQTNYAWTPNADPFLPGHYNATPVQISAIAENYQVEWLYKKDVNIDGVPDELEGSVQIQWLGKRADGSTAVLKQTTIVDLAGTSKTFSEDKNTHLAEPSKWVIAPAASYLSYTPVGNPSPETVSIAQGSTGHIYFWYNADSNENGINDEDEKITIRYRVYGDYTTPLIADQVVQPFVLGSVFSDVPDEVEHYYPVGWTNETYNAGQTDGELHLITSMNSFFNASYQTSVNDNNQAITYIYKKIAEPVVIHYKAVTYAGTTVSMPDQVLSGLVGEDVTSQIDSPFANNSLWDLDLAHSTLPSGNLILTEAPQTYNYVYKEHLDLSIITYGGVSTDDKLNIEHTMSLVPTAVPVEITADEIPNYRVTGYRHYDQDGNLINTVTTGVLDRVTIDPADGSQKIQFIYVCLDTTVYIKAIGPQGQVLATLTKDDARVGEPYAVIAPYVDYYVLDDDLVKMIPSVSEGTNIVEFHYALPADVQIEFKEVGVATPIKRMNVTMPGTFTQAQLEAELDGLYYTLNPTQTAANGAGAMPLTISDVNTPHIYTVYFDKLRVPVLIRRVDQSQTAIAADLTAYLDIQGNWLRAGEMGTVVTQPVVGWRLREADSKSIYIDPASTAAAPQIV